MAAEAISLSDPDDVVASPDARRLFTRLLIGECSLELAEAHVVFHRIHAALGAIPTQHREYVANALLTQVALTMAATQRGAVSGECTRAPIAERLSSAFRPSTVNSQPSTHQALQ